MGFLPGFNPLPVIKPGVTRPRQAQTSEDSRFNPLPVIKPGVTPDRGAGHQLVLRVSIHSRLLSRELRVCARRTHRQ
ncbi:protein of unknown function [Methylocaldum szegediense]|uniref:Uncharacterized protein n=1 Tax=Methylocaldum szegediense TaxID=73780 RepID=A0ABM9I941_9GAMM|nr:protein of unknown function [Methylocaldum szegediense]